MTGGGAFPTVLRGAIRDSGLTLERLRIRLADRGHRVGLSTLSGWQHGRARPASRQVVAVLEEILGLTGGELTGLVPSDTSHGGDSVVGRLLAEFPSARTNPVDVLHREDTVVIGPERQVMSVRTRELLRARRDGADRVIGVYVGDSGCDISQVRLEARDNCLLGEVRRDKAENPAVVGELLFGEPLRRGETWVMERQVVDGTGGPATEFACGVRRRIDSYVLQVRFDPAALPASCGAFAQADGSAPRQLTADLRLNSHHTVHMAAGDIIGGLVGITWSWED